MHTVPPIICVTLNAAIDRTYYGEHLRIGSTNRVSRVLSQAGGKGNNVARAIHRLGGSVVATGFIGGHNGRMIQAALEDEAIPHAFCQVRQGESRVCLTVVDVATNDATEIIEPGIRVTTDDVTQLMHELKQLVVPGGFVVFSGSLPPGCSVAQFLELIGHAKALGARVIVDTSGEALIHSVQCHPFCIKPNEHEVNALLQASSATAHNHAWQDALTFNVGHLYDAGVELPIVTLGANGAIACDGNTLYRVQVPKVDVVNTVGSGDAFLGAFVYGLTTGYSVVDALALGAAAGASNATKETAATIDREEVNALLNEVTVTATPRN